MRPGTNRNSIKSEINITPFTDVVLVLLIIFMIATPALMQPEIKVNLPKTESADNKDTSSNIEVLIYEDGRIMIDGREIELSNVEKLIESLLKQHPDKSIIIKGDVKTRYNYVIQFMDEARKAGAKKFALAVEVK
ncbi:MAG: biopolymer transporter ExbD [Endomicrobium sp.]|jgi:biopolymer transport protein ExbD|nr:biopolymer transporter ExbD [Endomicrobium sp.]